MSDNADAPPRAIPLSPEQLRRAYQQQIASPDQATARAARVRLAMMPKEPEREPPVEEESAECR